MDNLDKFNDYMDSIESMANTIASRLNDEVDLDTLKRLDAMAQTLQLELLDLKFDLQQNYLT